METDLPHDKMAEEAILGSIIIKNNIIELDQLAIDDFFSPSHQKIYQSMFDLSHKDEPIDEVTLGRYLQDRGWLDLAGGVNYLIELTQSTPIVENADYYVKIIKEKSKLRNLIYAANNIAKEGLEGIDPAINQLQHAKHLLESLDDTLDNESYISIKDCLLQYFETLEKKSKYPDKLTGLETGYKEIDRITSGLQPGDLIVLAARPSIGKTALATSMGYHTARNENLPHIFFSVEMPRNHICMRLLASEARVNTEKLMSGNLDQADWDKLTRISAEIMNTSQVISDKGDINTDHIYRVLKKAQKEYGQLGIVTIDYLQLMDGAQDDKSQNRNTQISKITRKLKSYAKQFQVPIILLSQLNRELEKRIDKRPRPSDLRDSGSIEADADIIMFIYRDEVYNENTPDQGIAEIIFAKNRNGRIGNIHLKFEKEFTRFSNSFR